MPVLELCNHLQLLSQKLQPLSSADAYRVGRIWQNVRLDLPCIHNCISGKFSDGFSYPNSYPLKRGANVSTQREQQFVNQIQSKLADLDKIVCRSLSGRPDDVLQAMEEYFDQIEQSWGSAHHLTTDDSCNGNNCASVNDLPAQLSRYVDFKSFVAYTLLPKADPARWQLDDAKEFIKQLDLEKSSPGKHWRELAAIWKDVRNRIRQGILTFQLPPRYNNGDVKFVGDGDTSVHDASPHAPGSRERLHYVIQELALPSWEKSDHRESKLGMVVLSIPRNSFNAYRPTILDNFGSCSYFFLPACNNCPSGKTWKLNDTLDENSMINHGGQAEWTAIVQNPGISCTILVNGKPEPAFNLVGLEFGSKHASLFEI